MSQSVSDDEQSTEEETKVEEVEEPDATGYLAAPLPASEAVMPFLNTTFKNSDMRNYVTKQRNLIKSRSERQRVKELLSEMTLEQQVAYFVANAVTASD